MIPARVTVRNPAVLRDGRSRTDVIQAQAQNPLAPQRTMGLGGAQKMPQSAGEDRSGVKENAMAHLWVHQDQEDHWAVLPLDGKHAAYCLTGDPDVPVRAADGEDSECTGAYIIRHGETHATERWHLYAAEGARVLVNGEPLGLGMRVLRNHDQIQIGRSGPMIFATERVASIQPFPGADRPVSCPRCGLTIEPGRASVSCPHCGVWHHQVVAPDDLERDRQCWTYADTCASCAHQRPADDGFGWSPEGL